jgi:hypothetical protein
MRNPIYQTPGTDLIQGISNVQQTENKLYGYYNDSVSETSIDEILFEGICALQYKAYMKACIEAGHWLPDGQDYVSRETVQVAYAALLDRFAIEGETGMKQLTLAWHTDTAISATGNTRCAILKTSGQVIIPRYCALKIYNASAQSNSNYYTFSGSMMYGNTKVGIYTGATPYTTKAFTSVNLWHNLDISFYETEYNDSYELFYLDWVKTGSPGNIWVAATFCYDLAVAG